MAENEFHYSRRETAAVFRRQIDNAPRRAHNIRPFTPRQLDVLHELCRDKTNKEIGKALTLAPETVHHHLKAIFSKLAVHRRDDAVEQARRLDIVSCAAD